MFEDYCAAHGKPCIPGSLYCSEECRLQDIEDNLAEANQMEIGSPLSEHGEYLMYECCFCNHHHSPSESCPSNYNLGKGSEDELDNLHNSINGDEIPKNFEDEPIYRNNGMIQSNYRKWLVGMSTP